MKSTKQRKYTINILAVIVIVNILSLSLYSRPEETEVIEPTPKVEIEAVPPTVKTTPPIVRATPPRTEEIVTDTEIEETPVIERTFIGEFQVTAYCPCSKCCGEWADGITYTGTVATENRTIAVDPYVIPLGSIVEINGTEYVAEDIGGAINGNRIDIFFENHETALEWGIQYHDIFLIN